MPDTVTTTIFAPASVGNFGPFFDVMGYCLDYLGDVVEASTTKVHREIRLVRVTGPFANDVSRDTPDPNNNCALIVARYICSERRYLDSSSQGLDITLHKYMPLRTGLGSSAASAVGAAKAIFFVLQKESLISQREKARAALAGEMATSEHPYYDNIVPSYFGGVKVIRNGEFIDLSCPDFWTVAVILDRFQLSTQRMRKCLFTHIGATISSDDRDDAIGKVAAYLRFQSSSAATFVHALAVGNMQDAGRVISDEQDNILYEARHDKIPYFRELVESMKEAGALGCSISGSGPAIFCITGTEREAFHIRDTIIDRFRGRDPWWLVSPLNRLGATHIDSVDEWVARARQYHNFWDGRL